MNNWLEIRDYLICWIEDKKEYTVRFKKKGDVNFINTEINEIIIDELLPPELQTYILLHECGHILIWENGMILDFEKKAKRYNQASSKEKTFTVIEEIEAWKRGLSLASRLSIPVDLVKWEGEMADAIYAYMIWATSAK